MVVLSTRISALYKVNRRSSHKTPESSQPEISVWQLLEVLGQLRQLSAAYGASPTYTLKMINIY